jgi:hypothetical protein
MTWLWTTVAIVLVVALVVAYFYDRRHRQRGDLIEGGGMSRRDRANEIRSHITDPDP